MKTASKVFIIISMVMVLISFVGGGIVVISFGSYVPYASTLLLIVPSIMMISISTIGASALSSLEKAEKHNDLVAMGVLTMIFCSFLGGLFMLLIKDEELKSNSRNYSRAKSAHFEQKEDFETTRCAKCGKKVENGKSFCGNCGELLYKICPKCNMTNSQENKFCESCGSKLDKE